MQGRSDASLSVGGRALMGWLVGGGVLHVDKGMEERSTAVVCSGCVVAETYTDLRV